MSIENVREYLKAYGKDGCILNFQSPAPRSGWRRAPRA